MSSSVLYKPHSDFSFYCRNYLVSPRTMAYLPDVKKRLGDNTVEVISDYSREGKLTSQQLSDFALKLEENSVIFGNHIRRKEGNSYKGGADELRAILCDWWGYIIINIIYAMWVIIIIIYPCF